MRILTSLMTSHFNCRSQPACFVGLVFAAQLLSSLFPGQLPADDPLLRPPGLVEKDATQAQVIDFNRDIRPILADNCFACHGFDEHSREADLRLDRLEEATADRGGRAAIVPGKPEKSELIARITANSDELMPPAGSHRRPLSPQSAKLIADWIRQGAVWGKHWSFVPPRKADVPADIHPIDYFVRRQLSAPELRRHGLQPAAPAKPYTLLRRLSFDLTGLPPSIAQYERFMDSLDVGLPQSSKNVAAWKELIEQLLASPHYGERMAMWWLDGARYSDTDGFQIDATRNNWPWRDWVISAFNANKPFDQFTIEQFAGDLLAEATEEQQLATCFHRNHMNNGEGGRDPEESRVDYVLDRVNTMGTLWLGLTLGCTQCHDHKFDPISQRDYYSLTAYFNSIDETGRAGENAGPFLDWRSPTASYDVEENQRLLDAADRQILQRRAELQEDFQDWFARQVQIVADGFQPWKPVRIAALSSVEGYALQRLEGDIIVAAASALPQDDYIVSVSPSGLDRITGVRLDVFPHAEHTDGKLSFSESGEFILTNVKLRLRRRGSSLYREVEIAAAVADVDGKGRDEKYVGIAGTLDDDPRTGWTTRTFPATQAHWAVFELAEPLTLAEDELLDIILMQRSIENRELIGRFRLSVTEQRGLGLRSKQPMPLEQLAKAVSELPQIEFLDVDPELRSQLFEQFLEDDPLLEQLRQRQETITRQLAEAKQASNNLKVMVLRQREQPRRTFILERGVWENHGDEVTPGVLPAVLPRTPEQVPTRKELAEWIVSAQNPLTARVIVNQVWQQFFGEGLVRTPSDFGVQGEMPSHPDLLDWLAVEFVESGWDLKHLIETIVTSQTYCQASDVSPLLRELDPENRLLARGARFRLPAWMIRDARLAISGQLNRRIGGPPVFPYQPDGVWKDQFMGRFAYQPTLGPGQYRRTVYAFWRRSSAPSFLFDSAMRRTCEVEQRRTNTPLHALTLLNDLTGQEVARTLAEEFKVSPSAESEIHLRKLWLRILGRDPTPPETEVLVDQYARALVFYAENMSEARRLLSIGQLPLPENEDLAEKASMMVVCSMILNLDECITHE